MILKKKKTLKNVPIPVNDPTWFDQFFFPSVWQGIENVHLRRGLVIEIEQMQLGDSLQT